MFINTNDLDQLSKLGRSSDHPSKMFQEALTEAISANTGAAAAVNNAEVFGNDDGTYDVLIAYGDVFGYLIHCPSFDQFACTLEANVKIDPKDPLLPQFDRLALIHEGLIRKWAFLESVAEFCTPTTSTERQHNPFSEGHPS